MVAKSQALLPACLTPWQGFGCFSCSFPVQRACMNQLGSSALAHLSGPGAGVRVDCPRILILLS